MNITENEGIIVKTYDPYIKSNQESSGNLEEAIQSSDCLVVVTDYDIFTKIDPSTLSPRQKCLVDTRNILDHNLWKKQGYQVKVAWRWNKLSLNEEISF